jgi:hypothetical protein
MAPAAYHRIVYSGEANLQFLRIGSRFRHCRNGAAGSRARGRYIRCRREAGSAPRFGAAAGVFVLAALAGFGYLCPLVMRYSRS